ncbi:glycine betaine ABC transporter substrate-binding protein, partial [Streptomyces sp. 900116325]
GGDIGAGAITLAQSLLRPTPRLKNYPQLTKWFKDFKLSEQQLAGLENEIQKRGTGHEEEAVKAWMDKNPGIADKMAPQ